MAMVAPITPIATPAAPLADLIPAPRTSPPHGGFGAALANAVGSV
jgi:hypothetical protein